MALPLIAILELPAATPFSHRTRASDLFFNGAILAYAKYKNTY
jgi:hypothetical protein